MLVYCWEERDGDERGRGRRGKNRKREGDVEKIKRWTEKNDTVKFGQFSA